MACESALARGIAEQPRTVDRVKVGPGRIRIQLRDHIFTLLFSVKPCSVFRFLPAHGL